jgi:hypothetical protein
MRRTRDLSSAGSVASGAKSPHSLAGDQAAVHEEPHRSIETRSVDFPVRVTPGKMHAPGEFSRGMREVEDGLRVPASPGAEGIPGRLTFA